MLQISAQKLICNWLAKTDQKLTSSAVELETDVKYSAVINSQVNEISPYVCHRVTYFIFQCRLVAMVTICHILLIVFSLYLTSIVVLAYSCTEYCGILGYSY